MKEASEPRPCEVVEGLRSGVGEVRILKQRFRPGDSIEDCFDSEGGASGVLAARADEGGGLERPDEV